ncbi:hypothetical protein FSP39_009238 [Pinctada imbricata]|uniref:VPS37 C-terminal domain-containing protein n=1 Tax=Pinctada imbricata TaxID=66713 RepID=A0AA88XX96_PINIB|nr:hypothetical protein FSP39_009238 [Pinctada imbricata]
MYSSFRESSDNFTNSTQLPPPDEDAAVGLVQHLNKEELQNLLDNNDKLEELLNDLQQVKSLQTNREMMLAQNKSMADFSLSLQPRLDELKREVGTAYEEANTLKVKLATDKSKLDDKMQCQSLDTVLALLQTETAASEELTEQLADKFCDNEINLENFLENYIPQRKVAHLRQIKVQKLTELVRNPSRAQAGGGYVNGPTSTPYPANMSMPQPFGYGNR